MVRIIWAPKRVVLFLFLYNYGIVDINVGLGCSNASLVTSFEKFNYKSDIKTITIP